MQKFIDFISKIYYKFKLNKAECVLYKQKKSLDNLENKDFSDEFYSIIPYFKSKLLISDNRRNLREKFEICQLLKDVLSVNESTNWNLKAPLQSKYKAIGSLIQEVHKESNEYLNLKHDIETNDQVKLLNIFEISRPSEHLNFTHALPNQKRLYHGSRVNNFLGILSRGLLLPKCVTNEYGNEIRSDEGLLGQGIYFSDSVELSLKYTTASKSNNIRLLAVCDVALGKCQTLYDVDTNLIKAPEGFQSVCGAKSTDEMKTKFEHNEFVIYDVNQYKLKYLVLVECAPFVQTGQENLVINAAISPQDNNNNKKIDYEIDDVIEVFNTEEDITNKSGLISKNGLK